MIEVELELLFPNSENLTLAIFYFSTFNDYLGFLMLFVEVLISTNPIAHRHHLTPGGYYFTKIRI